MYLFLHKKSKQFKVNFKVVGATKSCFGLGLHRLILNLSKTWKLDLEAFAVTPTVSDAH